MKILFVIPSLAMGGQEKAGMLLCNFLMQYHKVTVVCFEEKNIADFDYLCEIIRIKIQTNSGLLQKFLKGYKRLRELKRIKKTIKPDVSIAFGNTAIILNSLTRSDENKISSIRQSFLGIMNNNSFAMKIHRTLYVWALKRSKKIVSISEGINNELRQYFNIHNNIFINNGFDMKSIEKMASEEVPFFKNKRLWLIHSGRFDPSKGHWHLIKIFTEIKKVFPEATLLLLGSTETSSHFGRLMLDFYKDYLKKNNHTWSENEKSLSDVMFLGHQKNPFKYISKANLFIFPSLREGFPNALVEAMACTTPVVAADCPTGPREILISKVSGEKYGLLLPAFNDKFDAGITFPQKEDLYWAEQIISLLNDQVLLEFYKAQTIKRARHFSISEMGNKWIKVIEK